MTIIEPKDKFPPLPKSFKNRFPFRVCAPSFIYPAMWSENVALLAPYLDEIELLFLESGYPDSFPSSSEIKTLKQLSETHSLTYNIHLPTDVSLGAQDEGQQEIAVESIKKVIELSKPLDPSTYTLHLPFDEDSYDSSIIGTWQDRIAHQLEKVLACGVLPEKISVETLDYPFDWVSNVIDDLNLGVCMDVGHLIVHGRDPSEFYNRYQNRIDIIHLHGVHDQKDHVALTAETGPPGELLQNILSTFDKTLSLEVFNYNYLSVSLKWLDSLKLHS